MTAAEDFGRRLRERRIELKMTQRQLAEKAGFSNAAGISRIEAGQVEPGLSNAVSLANAAEIDLGTLVYGIPPSRESHMAYRRGFREGLTAAKAALEGITR